MKIIDGLRLATTKLLQKKVGSCLSGCVIGFGLVTLLLFMVIGSGLQRTVKGLYRDSLHKRYFGQVPLEDSALFEDTDKYKGTFKKYGEKELYKEIEITGIYKIDNQDSYYQPNGYNFYIDGKNVDDSQVSITFTDDIFLNDYLYKTSKFDDDFNRKIPIVVSIDSLAPYWDNPDSGLQYDMTNKENFEYIKSQLDKFWGEEYQVTLYKPQATSEDELYYGTTYPDKNVKIETDIEFVIVGFYSSISSGGYYYYESTGIDAFIPSSFLYDSNELSKFLHSYEDDVTSYSRLIVEFKDKKSRDKAIKDANDGKISAIYNTYMYEKASSYQLFDEILNIFRNIVYVIGGIMLIVASIILLVTISKLVKDSTKEIGVFRAVGAKRKDIRNIFFNYSSLISLMGLLIGIIIAYTISIGISVLWGEKLFYSIALTGNNYSPNSHPFVLVGLPIFQLLGITIVTYIIGCIAALFPAVKASRMDVVKALKDE